MKYLLSLPENTVKSFTELSGKNKDYFVCSDPAEKKVGSGGGTAWTLSECYKKDHTDKSQDFKSWLSNDKKIIIHGGGQSRRLPAYAPVGKSFIPAPIFRWERGQRINQSLLDIQLPLLENILEVSTGNVNTLIASGDAFILSDTLFDKLPDADVISLGMSVDPALASNHGVFVCSRSNPEVLQYMLQKPDKETLNKLNLENLFFIDTGIWLLSDKAVSVIMKKSGWNSESFEGGIPSFYDLYGRFGLSLGSEPRVSDSDINALSVAVVPLSEGNFYHFGTSTELISSSLDIQNKVMDQRDIWTRNIKPHPSIFTQNCIVNTEMTSSNSYLWIENSFIGKNWTLSSHHIITGVPENSWTLSLQKGQCLDFIPLVDGRLCIRFYGLHDKFRGSISDSDTTINNTSIKNWFDIRCISIEDAGLSSKTDIYNAKIFPVLNYAEISSEFLMWLISPESDENFNKEWIAADRLSSEELLFKANLKTLEKQRKNFRLHNIASLYKNYRKSVFFQTDLNYYSQYYNELERLIPDKITETDPSILMQDMMFRSRFEKDEKKSSKYRRQAFSILQNAILEPIINNKQLPKSNIFEDQIVWARSPVRIDLAGGWTDTPPNCNLNGGSVVTVSLELNGQPPLQAFIRPSKEKVIILRSIDLGEREVISTYEELRTFNVVGSPFSIPKAALALAGFLPEFCSNSWPTLTSQLQDFGCGIEISFLAAIPKGSGMGTSSILASTILGAISDFTGLNWDHFEICNRALGLEQLLTTGGGWQDQYGGAMPGLKLLSSNRGWVQTPDIRWLPDYLFTRPEYKESMLLYYTGITRVAKNILSEIVEGMFLNRHDTYRVLKELKTHAEDTFDVIQRGNFQAYGQKIARSWDLNKRIDSGTNNEQIQKIIDLIDDYSIGYKLPGAGGGGFLYIIAKDPEAAIQIKKILNENPPNARARFVDMNISQNGLQVSRS